METLRMELARAKEQARNSDAATLKVVEELRAEQAAHCQSKERMTKMAVELKDAADRYELLEKKPSEGDGPGEGHGSSQGSPL